jgi:hypothetical protein
MNTSESFQALRRANPRTRAGFAESVEAAADAVRTQIASAPTDRYTVTYSDLGATPALVAPENARRLKDRSPAGEPRPGLGMSK